MPVWQSLMWNPKAHAPAALLPGHQTTKGSISRAKPREMRTTGPREMRICNFPYIVYVLRHSGPHFDPSIYHAICGVERRDTPRWKEQNLGFPTRGVSPLNPTDSVRYEWIEVRTGVAQNVNVWKITNPHFPWPSFPVVSRDLLIFC